MRASHGPIPSQLLLMVQELFPGNITRMVVVDHHFPFADGQKMPIRFPRPAVAYDRPPTTATVDERARISRILQQAQDMGVTRKAPNNLLAANSRFPVRQRNAFLAIPKKDLPGTSQRAELGEHAQDRFLDLTIGNHLDGTVFG